MRNLAILLTLTAVLNRISSVRILSTFRAKHPPIKADYQSTAYMQSSYSSLPLDEEEPYVVDKTPNFYSPYRHAWQSIFAERQNSVYLEPPVEQPEKWAEKRLIKELLDDYEKQVRPVVDGRTPEVWITPKQSAQQVTIEFGLELLQILDLDEMEQVLTTSVRSLYQWTDYNLVWDPADFDGIESITVPSTYLWLPDIALYNYADERLDERRACDARVYSDGTVFWGPMAIFKSTCSVRIRYFPFDQQKCHLKFGPWTHDGFRVNISFFAGERSLRMTNYMSNPEWEIMNSTAVFTEVSYPCCPEKYPDISFHIWMRRQSAFYTYILIIPSILLSSLTSVIFWLPPETPSKVVLAMNVFVAFLLLHLLLEDTTPAAASSFPLLGAYYCFNMGAITLSMFLCCIIVNLHFHGTRSHKLPKWLRRASCVIGRQLWVNVDTLNRSPAKQTPKESSFGGFVRRRHQKERSQDHKLTNKPVASNTLVYTPNEHGIWIDEAGVHTVTQTSFPAPTEQSFEACGAQLEGFSRNDVVDGLLTRLANSQTYSFVPNRNLAYHCVPEYSTGMEYRSPTCTVAFDEGDNFTVQPLPVSRTLPNSPSLRNSTDLPLEDSFSTTHHTFSLQRGSAPSELPNPNDYFRDVSRTSGFPPDTDKTQDFREVQCTLLGSQLHSLSPYTHQTAQDSDLQQAFEMRQLDPSEFPVNAVLSGCEYGLAECHYQQYDRSQTLGSPVMDQKKLRHKAKKCTTAEAMAAESLRRNLKYIITAVRRIQMEQQEKEIQQKIVDEWRTFCLVLDRLFFIVYIITLVVSSCLFHPKIADLRDLYD